jgi:hypothetical protein
VTVRLAISKTAPPISADRQVCERSPRARPSTVVGAVCGDGIPQPAWPPCEEPARWEITGYQHRYCTQHAATRIRARDALGGWIR